TTCCASYLKQMRSGKNIDAWANTLGSSRHAAVALMIAVLLSSCTAMKYVPNEKALYTKSEVKLIPSGRVRAKKKIKELLYNNINPKPNTSIFGMRPALWFYYIAGEPEKKGLRMFIKNKLGQAPVYMSDVDADKTAELLRGHLKNNGYFQAYVKSKTEIKDKKGSVLFTAHVHRPYTIGKVNTPAIDTLFTNIDSLKKESFVKTGQRYSLERLKAEQERLEEALENLGFYFFDDRHLIYEADSTVGDRKVDLTLMLETGVPAKARKKYNVGKVYVYPDYTLMLDTIPRGDTLMVRGFHYIDRRGEFRPSAITNVINIKPGSYYKRQEREYTLSHLMELGAFKFVNIRYLESKTDSATLDANIYLTPFMKKSIRAEFQAVSKSNNFVGPGLTLTFSNRNALRGSEKLDLSLMSGYEVQVSRKSRQALNAIEIGGEAKLSFPRILHPFKIHYPTKKYLPTTDIALGSRIQQRVNFFNLNSFSLSYGYTWKENTLKHHEFYPIDINFVQLGQASDAFMSLLEKNVFLARSFENQFIPGARYSYTLNTQLNEKRVEKFRERQYEPSHFYFNGKIDIAGNLLQTINGNSFKQDMSDAERGRILGAPYSQFFRGEVDFRHYWQFSEKKQFVSRLNTGVGYAYGNAVTMPYIKQFAIGGSTSIRAFPARSLGPGTYYVRGDSSSENRLLFIDQRGDIKVEANAELRWELSRTFKPAVFIDAGNIWLIRSDDTRPGGKFRREHFMKEFAVGAGAGMRMDFNFFVLRLDLAFPLRKPWLDESDRWVHEEFDFGSSSWRRENLILNIAIGYPF
ncbi:MAG TPA: BamA/TamA family outer membrane protein, partial [Chryseosolibacter sp.]|nr:BamA/TamA family outer membrane protein [Chryseosolibacter sp.]